MSSAAASFAAEPASVGAARRYAVGLLQSSAAGQLRDDVRTVVSELATNAVLHARTPFTISLHVDDSGVRIAVTDASVVRPRLPRQAQLPGTTGRGLRIVAELSAAWGVDVHDDGKTTWSLLAPPPPTRPPAPPEPAAQGASDNARAPMDAAGSTEPVSGAPAAADSASLSREHTPWVAA